jgi:hypothetical protein
MLTLIDAEIHYESDEGQICKDALVAIYFLGSMYCQFI